MASPSATPFHAVGVYSENENETIFSGGPSSLSVPLEIKPTIWQRLKAVDWLDWLSAFGALLAMYAVFGSYFYALLYAAEAIRGDNFRVLPSKYFGPFSKGTTPPIPNGFSTYPAGYQVPWNSSLS